MVIQTMARDKRRSTMGMTTIWVGEYRFTSYLKNPIPLIIVDAAIKDLGFYVCS
jgi:hypothetical protein